MARNLQVGRLYVTRGGDCALVMNDCPADLFSEQYVHVQLVGICGSYFVKKANGRAGGTHSELDLIKLTNKPFLSKNFNNSCVQVKCMHRRIEREKLNSQKAM